MKAPVFFRLQSLSLLDVAGRDAIKIVHNLTTNEVSSLEDHCGRETFVTDVKGKTVGHVFVFRNGESLRLIGAAGQSDRIAAHLDRYTIVEDAQATILDPLFSVCVLPPDSVAEVIPGFQSGVGYLRCLDLPAVGAHAYEVDWLGPGTMVLVSHNRWAKLKLLELDEDAFHGSRTIAGFPWLGIDFDENLPQEVNRNEQAISFTKGCYLGQETVARLDAMGQVQKKLVQWQLSGQIPPANAEVVSDGKTVGRLTSIAPTSDNEAVAIGVARRSHFDAGATATGISEAGEFTASVL